MTPMDDLVQFLRDRLDEDEQIARAAGRVTGGDDPDAESTIHTHSDDEEAVAEHMARHDPARVLREVDAKRRLLALHEPGTQEYVDGDVCMACTLQGDGPYYPCATLRLLALPYSDHPDYRDDWRP